MLLDIERTTAPMPVLDFFKGERDVSQVIDTLEAEWKGFSYDVHDVDTFIYGVGGKGADKNELYSVKVTGAPYAAINEAFVTSARRLLSYDDNEAYPQTANLKYDPSNKPLRPEVLRALTTEATKNNGSGKNVPHIVPR